jgi:hypothetical protein
VHFLGVSRGDGWGGREEAVVQMRKSGALLERQDEVAGRGVRMERTRGCRSERWRERVDRESGLCSARRVMSEANY